MIERLSPESRPLGKSGILVSPIAWGMDVGAYPEIVA